MMDHRNENQLGDAEVAAILEASPDATLVTDYLAGVLAQEEEVAFRERLRTDAAFREFAEPHLAAWEAMPRVTERMTPDELQGTWSRFQDRVGIPRERPAAAPTMAPVRALRIMQLAAAMLLLIGLPLAGARGYLVPSILRAPVTQMVTTDQVGQVVRLGRATTVTLETGSRFIYGSKADANGVREMLLTQGQALFVMEKVAAGEYVVLTPAGRITVTGTMFHVEVRNPQWTHVKVKEGEVLLQSLGASPTNTPLRLGPGESGLLAWGQPPLKEQP